MDESYKATLVTRFIYEALAEATIDHRSLAWCAAKALELEARIRADERAKVAEERRATVGYRVADYLNPRT